MKLFQNQVIFKNFRAINRAGWEAEDKFPALRVHRDLSTYGSKKWEPEFFDHYEHVADIDADDPEDAYLIHNRYGVFGDEEDAARYHKIAENVSSLSIGDLVEQDGKYFICDLVGFSEIEIA